MAGPGGVPGVGGAGGVLPDRAGRARLCRAGCAGHGGVQSVPGPAACLEFALRALPDGIAGGTTPQQRRELAARRGPGHGQSPVGRGGGFDGGRLEHDSAGRVRSAGATRAEVARVGRAALRAGSPVRAVARECGVSERTVQRWAHRARAG